MSEHGLPHTLIIEDIEGEKQWRIVHPATCPWDAYRASRDYGRPGDLLEFEVTVKAGHYLFGRACLVNHEIESCGLDSLDVPGADGCGLDAWKTLAPGRYKVQAWSTYYPGDYGGSLGAEWDTGMQLVVE